MWRTRPGASGGCLGLSGPQNCKRFLWSSNPVKVPPAGLDFPPPLPYHGPCTNSGRGVLEDRGALGSSLGQVYKGKRTPSMALQPMRVPPSLCRSPETNVPLWVWEPLPSLGCPSCVLVLSGFHFPSSPCSPDILPGCWNFCHLPGYQMSPTSVW